MSEAGVNACTDITGFGLLGHAMEVAKASSVNMIIEAEKVCPFCRALKELVRNKKFRPKNISANMDFLGPDLSSAQGLRQDSIYLLFDPQTSGGLLISVATVERSGKLLEALKKVRCWRVL